MQNGFHTIDDKGVAGVGSTLVALELIGLCGENINDFAFSFVAPLGSNNDDSWHADSFIK